MNSTYIFSALLMGGLTNHLLFKAFSNPSIPMFLVIYLLCSPVVIYAGISGGSLALYLVFYYLFFSFIMKYTESFSVFHLTLISILIGIFIFLDIEFLKLLLLLIPIFFFSSFYKAKGINGTFYNRASLILSNDSQRRKFFSSFFSSIFVAAFIPLMAFLTFLIINKVFAGNWYYFLESYGNEWNTYATTFPFIYDIEYYSKFISANTSYFLLPFLLLSLLALFQVFSYGGVKTKSILLILAILFLLSEVQEHKLEKLTVQHLSMLTGAGIVAAFFSFAKPTDKSKFRRILLAIAMIVGLFLEWIYFSNSIQKSESLFFSSFTETQNSTRLASKANFKESFRGLTAGRILIDDAIFYPELLELPRKFTWEGHFSSTYQHALQQPELYADYVVMTKSTHPLYLDDIVATAYKRLEMNQVPKNLTLLYEDSLFEIYQIMRNPIAQK
ncbi:hypothetical protein IPZ59_02390 [Mongoliitalea daihaiensis]|nr:hypothetical protein IPZ59_02390 [Mongoliitalea daihaiensis]